MNFEAEFLTLLKPLVAGGAWANIAPDGTVKPYITYSRIAALEENTIATNGGAGNLINTRMQIDIWALQYADSQLKARAVKMALKGWDVPNVLLDEQDFYESDTKIHRVMLDVSIWHH